MNKLLTLSLLIVTGFMLAGKHKQWCYKTKSEALQDLQFQIKLCQSIQSNDCEGSAWDHYISKLFEANSYKCDMYE